MFTFFDICLLKSSDVSRGRRKVTFTWNCLTRTYAKDIGISGKRHFHNDQIFIMFVQYSLYCIYWNTQYSIYCIYWNKRLWVLKFQSCVFLSKSPKGAYCVYVLTHNALLLPYFASTFTFFYSKSGRTGKSCFWFLSCCCPMRMWPISNLLTWNVMCFQAMRFRCKQ